MSISNIYVQFGIIKTNPLSGSCYVLFPSYLPYLTIISLLFNLIRLSGQQIRSITATKLKESKNVTTGYRECPTEQVNLNLGAHCPDGPMNPPDKSKQPSVKKPKAPKSRTRRKTANKNDNQESDKRYNQVWRPTTKRHLNKVFLKDKARRVVHDNIPVDGRISEKLIAKNGELLPFTLVTHIDKLRGNIDLLSKLKGFLYSLEPLPELLQTGILSLEVDKMGNDRQQYPDIAYHTSIPDDLLLYGGDLNQCPRFEVKKNKFRSGNLMYDTIISFLGLINTETRQKYMHRSLWIAPSYLRHIIFIYPLAVPFVFDFPNCCQPNNFTFHWLYMDPVSTREMLRSTDRWTGYVNRIFQDISKLKFYSYNLLFNITKWICSNCSTTVDIKDSSKHSMSHIGTGKLETPYLLPYSGIFDPVGVWYSKDLASPPVLSVCYAPTDKSDIGELNWHRHIPHLNNEFLKMVVDQYTTDTRLIKFKNPNMTKWTGQRLVSPVWEQQEINRWSIGQVWDQVDNHIMKKLSYFTIFAMNIPLRTITEMFLPCEPNIHPKCVNMAECPVPEDDKCLLGIYKQYCLRENFDMVKVRALICKKSETVV